MKVIVVFFMSIAIARGQHLSLTVTHAPSDHTNPTALVFAKTEYFEFECNKSGYGIPFENFEKKLEVVDLKLSEIIVTEAKFIDGGQEFILQKACLKEITEITGSGGQVEFSVPCGTPENIHYVLATSKENSKAGSGWMKGKKSALLAFTAANVS